MITTLTIIGIIVCIIGLSWISTKEKWDNITKPPKGWLQHNGTRYKINKP